MKKIFVPLVLLSFICACSSEKTKTEKKEKAKLAQSDSTEIKIDSVTVAPEKTTADYFHDLLTSLEKKDFEQFEQFISPKFSDPTNELWFYVTEGSDEAINLLGKEEKPFSKKDWKKYYLKVFKKDFIETVTSLKLEEITKKKTIESRTFKQEKTIYYCWTDFDKKAQELIIHVNSEMDLEDEEMNSEFSTSFHFKMDAKGKPSFVKFMMAG